MRKTIAALMFALLVCLAVCLPAHAQDKSGGKVKAFVSILPPAFFVQRVGGPHVEVTVLAGPGQDPHTFDPSPKLMAKLATAQVLFKIGFPFEEAIVKKIAGTYKNVEVVDLQKGIKLRAMTEEEAKAEGKGHDHKHKRGHSHESGEMDPHTWLDPQRAKIQARTIADTLIRLDPSHRTDYEKNLEDFQNDLDAIDRQLARALSAIKGKSFYVFHPAFGYLGDRYGLKQIAVESQGKQPTAKQLARLIELAKKDGVKVIFVQPQFSRKSAQALSSAIGAAVVPLDDLAPDYLKNLKDVADALESALSGQRQ